MTPKDQKVINQQEFGSHRSVDFIILHENPRKFNVFVTGFATQVPAGTCRWVATGDFSNLPPALQPSHTWPAGPVVKTLARYDHGFSQPHATHDSFYIRLTIT